MTAQNFMNVVRFKLKSDYVDKYFEVIDKTSFGEWKASASSYT